MVRDWDLLEKHLHYTYFERLHAAPEVHPLLISEPPLNPRLNRERLCELLFETFNMPAVFLQQQCILSLSASGRTTGIVLDSGEGVTHTVPIYEGYALPHAIIRLEVAGLDICASLQHQLEVRGYAFQTPAEKDIIRDIKEKLTFVSLDREEDKQLGLLLPPHSLSPHPLPFHCLSAQRGTQLDRTYEMPDGTIIALGAERFEGPEALFQPSLVGRDALGLHELAFASIQRCDVDVRRELYANLILSGGSTVGRAHSGSMKSVRVLYGGFAVFELF